MNVKKYPLSVIILISLYEVKFPGRRARSASVIHIDLAYAAPSEIFRRGGASEEGSSAGIVGTEDMDGALSCTSIRGISGRSLAGCPSDNVFIAGRASERARAKASVLSFSSSRFGGRCTHSILIRPPFITGRRLCFWPGMCACVPAHVHTTYELCICWPTGRVSKFIDTDRGRPVGRATACIRRAWHALNRSSHSFPLKELSWLQLAAASSSSDNQLNSVWKPLMRLTSGDVVSDGSK